MSEGLLCRHAAAPRLSFRSPYHTSLPSARPVSADPVLPDKLRAVRHVAVGREEPGAQSINLLDDRSTPALLLLDRLPRFEELLNAAQPSLTDCSCQERVQLIRNRQTPAHGSTVGGYGPILNPQTRTRCCCTAPASSWPTPPASAGQEERRRRPASARTAAGIPPRPRTRPATAAGRTPAGTPGRSAHRCRRPRRGRGRRTGPPGRGRTGCSSGTAPAPASC